MLSHWAAFINLWDNLAFVPMLTLSGVYTQNEVVSVIGIFHQSSGSAVTRFQLQAWYGINIIKRIGASSTGGHVTSPPCH
jgi:hypothetical protein